LSDLVTSSVPGQRRDVSVVYRATGGVDAIDQYSRRLVAALGSIGIAARYVPGGFPRRDAETAWILLEYQPFSYARWGFAPGLIGAAARARRRHGVRLAVMVHEAWVPMIAWRSTLMGLWQRVQLRALVRMADCVMTSTETIARAVAGMHVPVPATITAVDSSPGAARAQLDLDGRLTVAMFGRNHESRALDHAQEAITALALSHGPERIAVLNLGVDAPVPHAPSGVEVRSPGLLPAEELSLYLWASDLVLLPLTDGVSTRRSTLMSALAHGRPVVGLLGHNTDSVLATAGDALVLTPVGDRAGFARNVVTLAGDPVRRQTIGDAGRRLYEERFDWPVLARTVASVVSS
jgi:glycosyltransferase involved in cell wall biosynthesis